MKIVVAMDIIMKRITIMKKNIAEIYQLCVKHVMEKATQKMNN